MEEGTLLHNVKVGNHSFFILLLLFHVQCKTLKFIRIFLWIFSIIFQTCLLQAYYKNALYNKQCIYTYTQTPVYVTLFEIILLYLSTNQKRFRKIIFYITKIPTNFDSKFILKPLKNVKFFFTTTALPSLIQHVPAKKIYWRAAMKHLPRITYPTC